MGSSPATSAGSRSAWLRSPSPSTTAPASCPGVRGGHGHAPRLPLGEGEFFINRVPCRLRDIYELFLDTGIGRDAYSFVNQKEIDAILSVRAEDRRAIFEEAAGIKKLPGPEARGAQEAGEYAR